MQPSEFADIFAGLGYGEDDHCEGGSHSVYVPSDDPSVVTNHGGLSYEADIAEGITLIVLDTAIYRTDEDETTRYNEAQQTAGYVSDDLLNWAAEQARTAKEKGNLVLAMSHHGLMPHYSTTEEQAWYMDSFRVTNWQTVADTLADAGVTAVLTGHTHANDIARHVSENNNVLYDIETAALTAYPCAWRTNNYGSSPLLDDVTALVKKAVIPSLNKQQEEDNPESTAAKMLSHAWQAFAEGDEAKQDAEAFAHERELLTGETLTESLRWGVWNELVNLDNRYAYPELSELMDQRVVEEGKRSIAIVQHKDMFSEYAAFGNLLLGSIDSLSDALMLGKWLQLSVP